MTNEVPEGWVVCTLDDVAQIQNGYAFPSKEFKKTGVPLIRQSNLSGDTVSLDKCVYLDPKWLEKKPDYILKRNDVLIGMSGSVGKLCIYDLDEPGLQNQRTGKISPRSTEYIEWRFLWEYLKTIERQLLDKGKGLGVLNVSAKDIGSLPFRLAPLAEQRRIAAKLEKLLDKVDICQERLSKILTVLKRFRRSVLAAACSGVLTAEWRTKYSSGKSVDDMIDKIHHNRGSAAKTTAQKRKIKEIYSDTDERESTNLPEQWRYVFLKKLCESFEYGTSKKSKKSGTLPVLRMGNIRDGGIDWNNLVYTSDDDEIKKYLLRPNTVLFNRTNSPELVGKTAIYRGEKPAIFAGYLIRINHLPELDPEYLNMCLNSSHAKEFCLRVKSDGVSQSNINAQKLGMFEVPFCPVDEQKEIVQRVKELFSLTDHIEARYLKARAYADKLIPSVLARAFCGDLVYTEAELAQKEGRDYESASVLLERICSGKNILKAQSRTERCQKAKRPGKKQNIGYPKNKTKRSTK